MMSFEAALLGAFVRDVSTGGNGGTRPVTFLAGGAKAFAPPLFDHKMKRLPVVMDKIT
jgi:hypothetical protein